MLITYEVILLGLLLLLLILNGCSLKFNFMLRPKQIQTPDLWFGVFTNICKRYCLCLPKLRIKVKNILKSYWELLALCLIYAILSWVNLATLTRPQMGNWQGAYPDAQLNLNFLKPTQVSTLYYYYGLTNGSFSISTTDINKRRVTYPRVGFNIESNALFSWEKVDLNPRIPITSLNIHVESPVVEFKQLFLLNNEGYVLSNFTVGATYNEKTDQLNNLFSSAAPIDYKPPIKSGIVFDEVFYATSAYQYLIHQPIFATNHPQLGNLLFALGISILGMYPMGFRLIPFLCGIISLALIYILARRLFRQRKIAILAAYLFMFDFMHFTINRYALIDSPLAVFVLLIYIFLFNYIKTSAKLIKISKLNLLLNPDKFALIKQQNKISLYLMSLCFGLAVATKWTGIFSLLSVLPFIIYYESYNHKPFRHYLNIVLIPVIIYSLTYVPWAQISHAQELFKFILDKQVEMWKFHTKWAINYSHQSRSDWWSWPLDYLPYKMYSWADISKLTSASIVLMGNPAIWWGGCYALIVLAVVYVYKYKEFSAQFILLAILSQYLPYALINRVSFIYYFYLVSPFWILALCSLFAHGLKRPEKLIHYLIYAYLGVTFSLFILFYPVLSGTLVSRLYTYKYLLWYSHWRF